ncbi:MBL fold metallo-hydrolase [Geofilum rubicundum]|uniref:Metal-dependent hydrolase n=1 Tax=Geofilum rubicundum JCM 15548 TaxID=1236989 RepID=A0A0E9LYA2_9BACT|nr:MBL fold metallo-hydrolase [Geofilum rubicundum]GAO30542.1 metal-dependent hydrolase [Geofilum rubicundum JCM 15548]
MLEICALASGSNGNCYYIGNGSDAILVDVGISRRQVLERMAQKGLNPEKLRAIFISHEHGDHFRGVRVLSNKLDLPVYMTQKSYDKSWGPNRPQKILLFEAGATIEIGGFKVHSFTKNHDAAEPCSFRIEFEGKNVGVFTDIGTPCDNVTRELALCHALFLESNYDEEMLWSGPYPQHLKVRVAGDKGHLSNAQAFELLAQNHHAELQVVYLSHLSEENNRPDIAAAAFQTLEDRFSVRVTNRYAVGDVFSL